MRKEKTRAAEPRVSKKVEPTKDWNRELQEFGKKNEAPAVRPGSVPYGCQILINLPPQVMSALDDRVAEEFTRYKKSADETPEQLQEANRIARARGTRAANAFLLHCREENRKGYRRSPTRTSVVVKLLSSVLCPNEV